jgi:uncharacterized protein (DUF983 family)
MLSVLSCKCPRCHEGNMFKYSVLTKPAKFMEMNTVCPICSLNLEQEPGYYYGAMFVSYAFGIAELVAVLFAMKLLSVPLSINTVMVVVSAVYLLLAPINFRWGRAGWIALFFRYDAKAKRTHIRN